CSLHQSPFFFISAATLALHWAQISSGIPCSLHHHVSESSVFFATVLLALPFACSLEPSLEQPPSPSSRTDSSENNNAPRNHILLIVQSSYHVWDYELSHRHTILRRLHQRGSQFVELRPGGHLEDEVQH